VSVWRDWSRTHEARVRATLRPRSLDELQAMMRRAHDEGAPVRPVGTGHSWSALIPTEGYLLDTTGLHRFLGDPEPSPSGVAVRVESGMLTRGLNDRLVRSGLRVPGLPIFEGMTVGGIVATGSHGSDLRDGVLADQVAAIELVAPDGELVRLAPGDGDAFRAAQISLGALGVVYSLELRCQPATRMSVRHLVLPREEALERMVELAREHAHASAYWFPYSDRMWFYLASPTEEPADFGPWRRAADRLHQAFWFRGFAGAVGSLTRMRPSISPRILRLSNHYVRHRLGVRPSRDAYHYLATFPRLVDSEYVVPIERAFEVYRAVIGLLEDHRRRGSFPVNAAIHARFLRAGSALLSPTGGVESMGIEAATMTLPDTWAFYREMGDLLMGEHQGRPHWGKWFPEDAPVRRAYGESFERFERVRHRFDPERRFLGPFLRKLSFGAPRWCAEAAVAPPHSTGSPAPPGAPCATVPEPQWARDEGTLPMSRPRR
jgi:L-gulonolactone oxidase